MSAPNLNRLDRFDDVFTELMIGFALALLIAIGFAPQLLGIPSSEWEIKVSSKNGEKVYYENIVCPDTMHDFPMDSETCILHGVNIKDMKNNIREKVATSLNSDKKNIEVNRLFNDVRGWYINSNFRQLVLYFLLILFGIKVIHEQSVQRYHLQNHILEESSRINFLMFLSRVLLLSSFYLFIVMVFINGHSDFGNNSYMWLAGLVCGAYILPDLILYRQLLDDKNPEDPVIKVFKTKFTWKWLYLDTVNIVFPTMLILGHFQINALAYGITLLLLLVIALLSILLKVDKMLKYLDDMEINLNNKKLFKYLVKILKYTISFFKRWVFEIASAHYNDADKEGKVLFVITIVIFMIAYYFILWNPVLFKIIHNLWAVNFILFVNSCDWILNRHFFFGKIK